MSTQKMPDCEEFRIDTDNLIAKFKELVNEGSVHRIILRNDEGKTLFEVPLTMGVAGAAGEATRARHANRTDAGTVRPAR